MLLLWHLYQISPTNHWYLLFVRLFEKDMFEGCICTHTVFEITLFLTKQFQNSPFSSKTNMVLTWFSYI